MLRSDGGLETSAYYRGGNSFPIHEVEPHATELLAAGRAVILLEPTNRFTNQLSALMRMDRPGPEQPGTFTVEALGPGYDVGDLTRGGIRPQITVSIAGVTWHRYERPWWADMNVTRDLSSEAEHTRRQARLYRLIPHFRIAAAHPNRNWRCLATSLSDLGAGRVVYWDIVDAAHKFAAAALPERRIA